MPKERVAYYYDCESVHGVYAVYACSLLRSGGHVWRRSVRQPAPNSHHSHCLRAVRHRRVPTTREAGPDSRLWALSLWSRPSYEAAPPQVDAPPASHVRLVPEAARLCELSWRAARVVLLRVASIPQVRPSPSGTRRRLPPGMPYQHDDGDTWWYWWCTRAQGRTTCAHLL